MLEKKWQKVEKVILGCLITMPHNNDPYLICQFLVKNQTTIGPQPLNSPDIAPCNFVMFLKLKSKMLFSTNVCTNVYTKNEKQSRHPNAYQRGYVEGVMSI